LHRPPPDIFTLPRNLLVFSKMQTWASGEWILAEMAAKKPAAPPPMIVIFNALVANELQDTQGSFIFLFIAAFNHGGYHFESFVGDYDLRFVRGIF
jgi:hypothetical protein